jgi:hypothetical protein
LAEVIQRLGRARRKRTGRELVTEQTTREMRGFDDFRDIVHYIEKEHVPDLGREEHRSDLPLLHPDDRRPHLRRRHLRA